MLSMHIPHSYLLTSVHFFLCLPKVAAQELRLTRHKEKVLEFWLTFERRNTQIILQNVFCFCTFKKIKTICKTKQMPMFTVANIFTACMYIYYNFICISVVTTCHSFPVHDLGRVVATLTFFVFKKASHFSFSVLRPGKTLESLSLIPECRR